MLFAVSRNRLHQIWSARSEEVKTAKQFIPHKCPSPLRLDINNTQLSSAVETNKSKTALVFFVHLYFITP